MLKCVFEILSFGFILCFDSLLYTFTILPIRCFLALSRLIYNTISRARQHLPPSQKADILRPLLIIISICILIPLTDVSKIYHSIRGQDTIKLYVIFNALEVSAAALAYECFNIPTFVLLSSRSRIGYAHPLDKTFSIVSFLVRLYILFHVINHSGLIFSDRFYFSFWQQPTLVCLGHRPTTLH